LNPNRSGSLGTAKFINHPKKALSDRLENTISIHTELVDQLARYGCDNCLAILRNVVSKYINRTSEGNGSSEVQISKGSNPNDIFNIRK
jgi:hypothetical protein